jgi:hypothetical protein
MNRLTFSLVITLTAAVTASNVHARDVQVMVLGTYHLANPGLDLHNVEVDDVTSESRQRQLEDIATMLAAFGPDRVAVEARSEHEDFSLASYEEFEPADLEEIANESVQIGFRLAHRLGHEKVFGIDEKDEDTDYYPFGQVAEFAEANDQMAAIEAMNRMGSSFVQTVGRLHAEGHIGSALHWINQPAMIERMQGIGYYGMLDVGDADRQPGALLNARYYERNARIFAKLMQVVEPGDRMLVVYGSGHSYWLRHFVSETPGFELVEPNDYLSALAAQ